MNQLFIITYISTSLAFALSWEFSDTYLVATRNGIVEGTQERTIHTGKVFYAYRGIPFAKPPVGDLRFELPKPIENWYGILDATKQKAVCLQAESTTVKTQKIIGSEDCLYLNIYTPIPPNEGGGLAVMVWIYGGGFFEGDTTSELYSPDYLINEDIIMVAIAYRLGLFGFFSTGDLVAPGNNGLKDQILGLKWVKENIEAFGGDPNKITIFGESAGAGSVSFLTQTPLTKGLYNRAIMQSGVSNCIWAISKSAPAVNRNTAALLGLNFTSSAELKQELKYVDSRTLFTTSNTASSTLYAGNPIGGLAIAPVIEPEHPTAVITKNVLRTLQIGDFNLTPLMIGFNSMEAIDFVITPIVSAYLNRARLESSNLVPDNFNIKNEKLRRMVGLLIKKLYFDDLSTEVFGDEQLLRYFSDVYFIINIIETAYLSSKFTDVYLYQLSYNGTLGNPLRPYNFGTGHAEDLNYLFYRATSPKILNLTDANVADRMVRLWTNFAKYGTPTPYRDALLQNIIWPRVDEMLSYLDIGANLTVNVNPRGDVYKFWLNLYEQYRELD